MTEPYTERQTKAEAALHEALREHALAFADEDDSYEDWMLNQFVCVSHWIKMNERGLSRYTSAFSEEFLPTHMAKGLLDKGMDIVDVGAEVE